MRTGTRFGLIWGVGMFIVMCLFFPWYKHEEITLKSIISGIIIFGTCGLILGYVIGKKNPDVKK